MSKIEWTGKTWNPITGCTKVSPGCAQCYAENIANRFWGDRKFSDVQFHPDRLEKPLKWRNPRLVFVNSMSDLFHPKVTDGQIDSIFNVMATTPRHTYQVLTKRPERMLELCGKKVPLPNVWLGVSVESQEYVPRIELLRQTPAAVRFVSCEPLLGKIDLSLDNSEVGGIHWVIAGGESGAKHRPVSPDWVRDIRDQCVTNGVPFFFKQWGGVTSKAGGRELDGKIWDEMPARLR